MFGMEGAITIFQEQSVSGLLLLHEMHCADLANFVQTFFATFCTWQLDVSSALGN
jgi:hypothetical protein